MQREDTTRVRGAGIAVAAALALLLPASAGAATLTVTSNLDENAAATDNGTCTLREAISAANTNATVDTCAHDGGAGLDTINLPSGSHTLTVEGFDDNDNGTGDLDFNLTAGSLTIDGPDSGPPAIIDSGLTTNPERILHSTADSVNTITLSDLVVRGGDARTDGSGGGLSAATDNAVVIVDSQISGNQAQNGAGVAGGTNLATVTVTDSVITGNHARSAGPSSGGGLSTNGTTTISGSLIQGNSATTTGTPGNGTAAGGGIDVGFGTNEFLTVTDSTIAGNSASATSAAPGPDASGGGVNSASVVKITNSTFSGNTATSPDVARGGGLFIGGGGIHTVAHSTFAGNDAAAGTATVGDAFGNLGGSGSPLPAIRGTIFSGPNPSTICGQTNGAVTLDDQGGNVDDGTSCDLGNVAQGSVESVGSPGLGALGPAGAKDLVLNTAGPPGSRLQLPVMQPLPTSPAVDRVTAALCDDAAGVALTTDERGFPRPFDTDENGDARCESGAVELYRCLGMNATIVGTPGNDDVLQGTNGPDVIHGGAGNDGALLGFDGDDRICGGEGNDGIAPRQGDDKAEGGPGTDRVFLTFAPDPVTVNLSTGQAQGHGTDTLTTIEDAFGSDNDDTLIGDGGDNTFGGGSGDDTYRGGTGAGPDGDDTFIDSDFGANGNTVDYSNRTDPVTVSVANQFLGGRGGATGGTEGDSITGVLDIVGGQAGDVLTGSNFDANRITGGTGNDTIAALGGADFIFVRDGGPDTVDCGTDSDIDTVEADVQGVDTLTNCLGPDVLDFLPPPATTPPAAATGSTINPPVTQPTPPAKKCKKGQKRKVVKGKVKCVKKKR